MAAVSALAAIESLNSEDRKTEVKNLLKRSATANTNNQAWNGYTLQELIEGTGITDWSYKGIMKFLDEDKSNRSYGVHVGWKDRAHEQAIQANLNTKNEYLLALLNAVGIGDDYYADLRDGYNNVEQIGQTGKLPGLMWKKGVKKSDLAETLSTWYLTNVGDIAQTATSEELDQEIAKLAEETYSIIDANFLNAGTAIPDAAKSGVVEYLKNYIRASFKNITEDGNVLDSEYDAFVASITTGIKNRDIAQSFVYSVFGSIGEDPEAIVQSLWSVFDNEKIWNKFGKYVSETYGAETSKRISGYATGRTGFALDYFNFMAQENEETPSVEFARAYERLYQISDLPLHEAYTLAKAIASDTRANEIIGSLNKIDLSKYKAEDVKRDLKQVIDVDRALRDAAKNTEGSETKATDVWQEFFEKQNKDRRRAEIKESLERGTSSLYLGKDSLMEWAEAEATKTLGDEAAKDDIEQLATEYAGLAMNIDGVSEAFGENGELAKGGAEKLLTLARSLQETASQSENLETAWGKWVNKVLQTQAVDAFTESLYDYNSETMNAIRQAGLQKYAEDLATQVLGDKASQEAKDSFASSIWTAFNSFFKDLGDESFDWENGTFREGSEAAVQAIITKALEGRTTKQKTTLEQLYDTNLGNLTDAEKITKSREAIASMQEIWKSSGTEEERFQLLTDTFNGLESTVASYINSVAPDFVNALATQSAAGMQFAEVLGLINQNTSGAKQWADFTGADELKTLDSQAAKNFGMLVKKKMDGGKSAAEAVGETLDAIPETYDREGFLQEYGFLIKQLTEKQISLDQYIASIDHLSKSSKAFKDLDLAQSLMDSANALD